MKRYQTEGIVLKRVNFGEADRIITFLTPENGKVAVIAKGVRKAKSKLAGGIELFSICDLSIIEGKGSVSTLTSTRLKKHFGVIVANYERMEVGYDAIRLINSFTDDNASKEHYMLLGETFELLNSSCDESVVACWLYLQIMKLNGSLPDTLQDIVGADLVASSTYAFSIEDAKFFVSDMGTFKADEIKAWRVFISASPLQLVKIQGLEVPAQNSRKVLKAFAEYQL
jgi:DNA repair protein RecO (recombination protein O)